jgi:hypothetical protein
LGVGGCIVVGCVEPVSSQPPRCHQKENLKLCLAKAKATARTKTAAQQAGAAYKRPLSTRRLSGHVIVDNESWRSSDLAAH